MHRVTLRSIRVLLLLACMAAYSCRSHAQVAATPSPGAPQVARTGTYIPLLSLDTVHFLEGNWTATSRDGQTALGSYSFVRELNGHVLARHSLADANCDPAKLVACARRDLFYVYQDSPGAPLHAISFDSVGHVLHYLVNLGTEASTSTLGRRDLVVFESDPSQLGPRVRVRYEHNVDTQTGKEVLNGAFDMLQPDGQWHSLQQWYGTRL